MARYPVTPDVRLEDQRSLTVRRTRSPQHTWNTTLLPWSQVPVMVAPVLAGETMKNAVIQARVMSSPVVSSVQGWWLEFYLFYVRVGDLDEADIIRAAIADPSQSMSSIAQGALPAYYHYHAGTPCYGLMCHKVVSRAYFRGEGETWNSNMVGSYPAVQVAGKSWIDSLHTNAEAGSPTDSDLWLKQWAAFQNLRNAKLTTNTWSEYLAKSGVKVPPQLVENVQDYRIPELVRFVRDFAYPVPTVDNATGLVRSTVQWSLAERIDKRRYFAEPGWLFGLMVVRPKVYYGKQFQNMTDTIQNEAAGFLPPEFETDPHTSLNTGGIDNYVTDGTATTCWFDRRDLFLYGDQYLGSPTSAGVTVALPAADLSNKKYPTSTDAHAMFVDTTAGAVAADGICTLRIASRIGQDATN